MRPHQFVLVCSIGILIGVAFSSKLALASVAVIISASLFGLVAILRPKPIALATSIFCLAILLGWWRGQSVIFHRPLVSDLDSRTAIITGQVVSDPDVIGNQQRLHLNVTSIDEEPRSVKIMLTTWHLPALQYADQFNGKIKFTLPQNTDEFQYSNYLAKDGIYLTATQAGEFTQIPNSRRTILGTLYGVKHWVNKVIHQFLPEPHGALLGGLLLGIKTDLPDDFRIALKNSGTSHIVALSGANLTIIITFMLFMLQRLPRRLVWLISGVAILGFVIMTGAASSVVRAAIMGWILLLAGLWGRHRSACNAILLATATMVLIHPLILFYDIGFQLSIAATIGLMYGASLFSRWPKWLPSFITQPLSATVGATIFTLPLIALYFGGVSWVTLGANLLIVPLVPYVMLVGCVGLAIFLIAPQLIWVNVLVWPLSALMFGIINWFGHLPSAFVELPPIPIWMPILYYLLLSIGVIYAQHRRSPQLV
ncbi:MAG: ComEC/Rec2 family competence protein [Patescibacteria group bacterium]|jgi:competence protein ComEC